MKKYIKRITVFITVVMSFGVMTNINLLDFNNAVYAVSSDVISQLRLKSGESGVGLYSRNVKIKYINMISFQNLYIVIYQVIKKL